MSTKDELKLRLLAELFTHLSDSDQDRIISWIISTLSEK